MCLHDPSTKKKIDLIQWVNRQRRFLAQIRPARIGGIGAVNDAVLERAQARPLARVRAPLADSVDQAQAAFRKLLNLP